MQCERFVPLFKLIFGGVTFTNVETPWSLSEMSNFNSVCKHALWIWFYTVSGSVKSYYTIIHFYLDNVNTITVMTAFHWIAVKLWLYFVLPVTLQLKTKSKYWYFNAGTTLNLCIFIMQCSLIVGLVFNTSSVYIIRVLLLAPLVSSPWIPLVKSVKWNIRPCPYLLNAKLYLPYELYGVFFHNSAFTACFCLL